MTSPPWERLLAENALESERFPWFVVASDGRVAAAGPGLARLAGRESVTDLQVDELFGAGDAAWLRRLAAAPERAEGARRLVAVADAGGRRHSVLARAVAHDGELVMAAELMNDATDDVYRLTSELSVLAREHRRQATELARALEERDRSHWHLRKLQDVLPICMDCGTVRPDREWMSAAEYLRQNRLLLSHGLCPPCAEHRFGELDDEAAPV